MKVARRPETKQPKIRNSKFEQVSNNENLHSEIGIDSISEYSKIRSGPYWIDLITYVIDLITYCIDLISIWIDLITNWIDLIHLITNWIDLITNWINSNAIKS